MEKIEMGYGNEPGITSSLLQAARSQLIHELGSRGKKHSPCLDTQSSQQCSLSSAAYCHSTNLQKLVIEDKSLSWCQFHRSYEEILPAEKALMWNFKASLISFTPSLIQTKMAFTFICLWLTPILINYNYHWNTWIQQ